MVTKSISSVLIVNQYLLPNLHWKCMTSNSYWSIVRFGCQNKSKQDPLSGDDVAPFKRPTIQKECFQTNFLVFCIFFIRESL